MYSNQNFSNYKDANEIKDKIRMNLKIDQNISSTPNKQLTNDRWRAILQALLENYKEEELKNRTINKVANKFNVSRNCVGKV